PLPTWFEDLAGPTTTRLVDGKGNPVGGEPDAVLILDTGSWSQLDEVRAWLAHRVPKAAIIDHHRQGDPTPADRRYIDTSAPPASTSSSSRPTAPPACASSPAPSPPWSSTTTAASPSCPSTRKTSTKPVALPAIPAASPKSPSPSPPSKSRPCSPSSSVPRRA